MVCQGYRGAVTTSVTPIDSTPTTEINDWVL
jgi:hypothetical protein